MMYTFKSCLHLRSRISLLRKTLWGLVIWSPPVSCETLTAFLPDAFPGRKYTDQGALLSLGHEKGYRRQQYLPQPYDAGARVCQILKPQRRSCLHSAARHCQERCAVCPVHLHRGRNPGHLGCFRPLETERWFPGAAICDPSYDKADVLLRSASI